MEIRKNKAEKMILRRVEKTIARHGLLEKEDKVLVACSGGADSSALLAVLLELREKYALRLAVGHFNHRLRPAAVDDERFVIRAGQSLGLPVYVRREDIRGYAKRHGLNIEEAGRERRYRFLRETARRIGASRIATGHTLTDQAETVLMRLLRGSGPSGLRGIAPCLDGLIVRPLIEVERREIETYLRARGILFREDETNRDPRYQRNRIRLRLIPYLERNFEPRVVRHLGRLAELSREEEDVWSRYSRVDARRAIVHDKGRLCLDARRLSSLAPAEGRRLVRAFLRAVKGDLRGFTFGDVEAVRLLAERKKAELSGKLLFGREKGLISVRQRATPTTRYGHEWNGKEDLSIPQIGLSFSAKAVNKGKTELPPYGDDQRALLDAGKMEFPLLVRSRKDGDRYRPLGAPGRKKLKEIMRAKGIPAEERNRLPVFVSSGEIVWVPGLPVAEDYKVTPATEVVLIISKHPYK